MLPEISLALRIERQFASQLENRTPEEYLPFSLGWLQVFASAPATAKTPAAEPTPACACAVEPGYSAG